MHLTRSTQNRLSKVQNDSGRDEPRGRVSQTAGQEIWGAESVGNVPDETETDANQRVDLSQVGEPFLQKPARVVVR
jgi:hypothetical protein